MSGREGLSMDRAYKRVAIERDESITVGDVFDLAKEAYEESEHLAYREVCMNAEIELRDDGPELRSVQEHEA
ncbi:hypothetical protein Slin14017_G057520 [Septoria linicola]|nr:hypothetical protein Slin14017_G057520 [Septoria linicola]